jgi:hypothetical protein
MEHRAIAASISRAPARTFMDAGGARAHDTIPFMIRIREIGDPDLRAKIVEALAARRGMSVAAIPDWFELDDADFVDLLNDLKYGAEDNQERDYPE